MLARAGAIPCAAPALDVLRLANARDFAARVREPLEGGSFAKRVATSEAETLAVLALPAPDGWLVRRTFGAAGRGRRRIRAGRPDDGERAWILASLRIGPLVIEPWVEVLTEYTRSAWVDERGVISISPPCFQATTREGAWTSTELAERGGVARDTDARLEQAVESAGQALARAGYFGPYGIDAYLHRVPGGAGTALNPISEINARYTMDWALAMEGRARPSLPREPAASLARGPLAEL